jgi:hypothetical protein
VTTWMIFEVRIAACPWFAVVLVEQSAMRAGDRAENGHDRH